MKKAARGEERENPKMEEAEELHEEHVPSPRKKKQPENVSSGDEGRGMLVVPIMAVVVGLICSAAYGQQNLDEEPLLAAENGSPSVSALFVLGDSSVDCGDNTLFYSFLHGNLSLHPCNGSDSTLLPNLLATRMGLPYTPTFYSQNGSVEGLLKGLNFGSAQGTIMNLNPHQNHQSLDQQLRQAFETIQLLQLHFGQSYAFRFVRSSLFLLSFARDDYVDLLSSSSSSSSSSGGGGHRFDHILVDRIAAAIRDLYDANVRRMVVLGVLPLGCAPRTVWQWYNHTGGNDNGGGCVAGVNQMVLDYNKMLERRIAELNVELPDSLIIFCDVYQGIMEVISNPITYGFVNVRSACCGEGWRGGMEGCASMDIACSRDSDHVWWDLYNPTRAVNSLLADSAWSGQPLADICRPVTIRELVSTPASLLS